MNAPPPNAGAGSDALAQRLAAIRLGRTRPDWHFRLLDLARDLTMADAAVVLGESDGGWRPLAPADATDLPEGWARAAAAARTARGVVAADAGGGRWLLAVPLAPAAVLAVRIPTASPVDRALTRERLALLAALADAVTGAQGLAALAPAAAAADAAAARLGAEDAALGLRDAATKLASLLPPGVQLALGRAKGAEIVEVAVADQPPPAADGAYRRALKLLMEEALDAGEPVAQPGAGGATAAARAWPEALAGTATLAVPAEGGGAAAVVLWHGETPRPAEHVAALLNPGLRLLALSARNANGDRRPRWVRRRYRRPLLIAAALIGLAGLLPRPDEVVASFVVQPERVQSITAPFDGVLEASDVRPGDPVAAGTVLARLATRELALEAASLRARAANDRREAAIARAGGRPAQEMIAELSARRAEAQLELIEYRAGLAEIRSPIDGVVLAGDLRRSLGQSLSRGQNLFEIAPPGALRAEILLPESRAHLVEAGDAGMLAPAADPAARVPVRIERVRPMAEAVQGRNVFRAIATIKAAPEAALLRPGAEGVARVTVGRTTWLAWVVRDPLRLLRRLLWI